MVTKKTSKKASKKHMILRHFPNETVAEKKNVRLDDILTELDSLKSRLERLELLEERVIALEDDRD